MKENQMKNARRRMGLVALMILLLLPALSACSEQSPGSAIEQPEGTPSVSSKQEATLEPTSAPKPTPVPTPTPEPTPQPTPEPTPAATPEPTVPTSDGDRIVFTGTIDLYSYDEVVALQGFPDPNEGYSDTSETFRLIVLDTPQNMNLRSGGGETGGYESQVLLVNVTEASGLEQYDGQHLTFSIDGENTWWPTDTSLPVGQPHTSDVHVLG